MPMKSDMDRELDELADQTEQQAMESARRFALAHASLLSDGVCRITSVLNANYPAVARIHTNLTESFPIFSLLVKRDAERFVGKPVRLKIRTSSAGTRYVIGLFAMPTDATSQTWPCYHCHEPATRSDFQLNGHDFYQCGRCAAIMMVED